MKKVIPFIIALPALLLIFVFKVLPAFLSVVISTKEYTIFQGINGSKSVGLKAYTQLFGMEGFTGVIQNTLRLNIFSIVLTCILAILLIVCISKMQWRWLKSVSIAILAIPALLPAISFVWVFIGMFSPSSGFIAKMLTIPGTAPKLFFADPFLYPLLFAVMDSLRNVFIPVIIGLLVCEQNKRIDFRKIAFVMIGYIAARATFIMSPDIEISMASSNPLIIRTSEILDAFSYRLGIQNLQFSISSAVWVLKTIIQLIINIAAYFGLSALTPIIAAAVDRLNKKSGSGRSAIPGIIGYILFASGSLAMIILTFIPTSGGLYDGIKVLLMDKGFVLAFSNSIIYCVLSCVIYGFVTFMLACPLSVSKKIYPFILVLVLSASNNLVGEMLFYTGLSMLDTIYPVIISSGLSVAGAFALHFCVSSKLKQDSPDFGQYVRASLLPLLSLILIVFITNWGGYLYQMLYFNRRNLDGIGYFGYLILTGNSGLTGKDTMASGSVLAAAVNIKSAFIFLSSIVPTVLGAILVALNRFLPLSAFTALIRKG